MVSNLRSVLNAARSLASKLPAEVLSQIFAFLRTPEVPTRDYTIKDMRGTFNESLATVNLVCRYWHQATTGAKDLWTHIAAEDTPDARRMRQMLELFIRRSGSFPLNLTFHGRTISDTPSSPSTRWNPRFTACDVDHRSPRDRPVRLSILHTPHTALEGTQDDVPLRRQNSSHDFPRLRDVRSLRMYTRTQPILQPPYSGPRSIKNLAPGQSRTITIRESAKLDHLKALSLLRFTAEEIIALLHSVTLPHHDLTMRFVDIRIEDSNIQLSRAYIL